MWNEDSDGGVGDGNSQALWNIKNPQGNTGLAKGLPSPSATFPEARNVSAGFVLQSQWLSHKAVKRPPIQASSSPSRRPPPSILLNWKDEQRDGKEGSQKVAG